MGTHKTKLRHGPGHLHGNGQSRSVTAMVRGSTSVMEMPAVFVFGLLSRLAGSQILSVPEACTGMTCLNGGVVEAGDEFGCRCNCMDNFTGLMCETELQASDWPNGPYATPMSIYGCPGDPGQGWRTGFLNMTFLLTSSIDSANSFINDSGRLELLGPVSRQVLRLNFCYKLHDKQLPVEDDVKWPPGNYAVYGAGGSCPNGFQAETMMTTLPPLLKKETDGFLPDIEGDLEAENAIIDGHTRNMSSIEMKVCHRLPSMNNAWPNWTRPFILLKRGLSEEDKMEPCPEFPPFDVLEETSPVRWRYCSYRRDRKHDQDAIQPMVSQTGQDPTKTPYLALKKAVASFSVKMLILERQQHDFPDSYWGNYFTDEDNLPWLLFELGQTIRLSSIIIYVGHAESTFDWTYGNAPAIEVSQYRWSFLSKGSLRCASNMEVNISEHYTYFLQRCHHSVRYVTIVMLNFRQYPNETLAFLKLFSKADVTGDGFGCGKDLGMGDGDIKDFQITTVPAVPSVNMPWWFSALNMGFGRPHGESWCTTVEGTDPYLQVDLLVATIVEGITIYNSEKSVSSPTSNVYKREIILVGTTEFRLGYGFEVNKLHNYTDMHGNVKSFNLDLSLPYSHPQTFLLNQPVLANIIRIHPQDDKELCLQIELIGCRKHRLTTLQCKNASFYWWQNQRSIFVSPLSYHAPVITMKPPPKRSGSQCWKQCESHFQDNCTGVGYNWTSCLLYNISETAIYLSKGGALYHYMYSQRICLDEPREVGPVMVSRTQTGEVLLKGPSETIYNPGTIITSIGYPVQYDSGYINKWTIDFEGKGYIEVLFTHIFLSTCEADSDGELGSACTDSVILTPKPWQGDAHSLRTYNNLLFENVTAVLNGTMNGQQRVYPTRLHVLDLLFQTCVRGGNAFSLGGGFRAIVSLLDMPPCQSSSQWSRDSCHLDNSAATLSSNSFLTNGDSNIRSEFWYMTAYDRYLILTFTDFDVVCNNNSLLEITGVNDSRRHKYCNTQRPVGDIVGREGSMTLRFSTDRYRAERQEGFRAFVKAVKVNQYIEDMDIQINRNTLASAVKGNGNDENFAWFEACVDDFGKCYSFYGPHPNSDPQDMPWTAINCSALLGPKAQLVTIGSKAENDFIIYEFQQEMVFKKPGLIGRSLMFHSYIGLERGEDIRNTLREQWVDGSPVTYTAWASHQPDNRQRKKCTKMAINSLYETNTWQTTDCNTPQASFFVCEVRTRTIPQDNLYSQLPKDNDTEIGFGYFLCQSGEVVSTVYVCDKVKDCLDGSDEIDCPQQDDPTACPKGYFSCSSGDCVSLSVCCDFKPDCLDASDEYCDFPACSEFQCDNQQCIPTSSVCDFKSDCYDGSDERDCDPCQESTTFKCNDGTCIPKWLHFDGFADCSNSEDELLEEPARRLSCVDWWHAGFRRSGMYAIDAQDQIECNFYETKSEPTVVETKYHNIGGEIVHYANGYASALRVYYNNLESVKELVQDGLGTCQQSVVQTCVPPRDRIAEIDNEESGLDSWPCHCYRIKQYLPNAFSDIEACLNVSRHVATKRDNVPADGNQPAVIGWVDGLSRVAFLEGMPITKMQLKAKTSLTEIRFKFEPVVCYKVLRSRTDELPCQRGRPVDPATKCLFEYDEYNVLPGCRDLTHLQNCENFDCPSGYVKCPGSFCLSMSLLCDGVRQCPGGQDELNCWCGPMATPFRFLVLFYDDIDMEETAVSIASDLHQQGNDLPVIDLVKYKAVDKRYMNTGLGKTSFKVNLYHTKYQLAKIKQMFGLRNSEPVDLNNLILALLKGNVLDINENGLNFSTVLIVLHKRQYQSVLHHMMSFTQSALEDVDLFVLAAGDFDSTSATDERRTLPTRAKYQAFKDWQFVRPSLLDVFSGICPEPEFPVCPGLYRCHASRICLPMSSLCDNRTQCPHGDDEKHCDLLCPANCSCIGYNVDCSIGRFTRDGRKVIPLATRSLDLNSNNITSAQDLNAVDLPFLVTLNMSHCGLSAVPRRFLSFMTNLLYLDLSFNQITELSKSDFANKSRLLVLDISGNNNLFSISSLAFSDLINLKSFAITGTKLKALPERTFSGLRLTSLDLSRNQIDTIDEHAFENLYVSRLNLEDNPISDFSRSLFKGITSMTVLRTGHFKLCCLDHLKDVDCYPYPDEFSSCKDLMRNDALRFLLWIIGVSALIGNALSLLYRLKFDRKRLKLGYGIFVTNLAVSDFLMGVYLLIIAVADSSYRHQYIFYDDWWRQSGWCSFAGIISTVSSEASIMFMCLITIDRIIVIKYPFGAIRFKTKSALAFAAFVWIIVLMLATIPLWFTSYFKKLFYARSGVCLALPLTRDRPPGWVYSISLFVGFNLLTFLLIAIGQWMIYREIHASSRKTGRTTKRKQDLAVARNLLLVVSTDFLCWFPIGVMGIMAFFGYVIPGKVYAWSAVLILPINSALNPFLYTFSAIISSKKFIPSVEEQSRTSVYTKDVVTKITDLWNSNLFLPRRRDRLTYIPMADYMRDQRLPMTTALLITMKLTNAIRHLHSVDLFHGELCFDDVYVLKRNNTIKAAIKSAPKCVSRQAEKKKDMEQLGNIIRRILVHIDPNNTI